MLIPSLNSGPAAAAATMQVWQFTLENVAVRMNQAGSGSMMGNPEISCDKAKVICADCKLFEPMNKGPAA